MNLEIMIYANDTLSLSVSLAKKVPAMSEFSIDKVSDDICLIRYHKSLDHEIKKALKEILI